MRRRNLARLKQLREKQFGRKSAWIVSLPCAVCGKRGPSDAHHYKSRGAGGDSRHLVPLCHPHHLAIHQAGVHTFYLRYGVDLPIIAAELEYEWRGAT